MTLYIVFTEPKAIAGRLDNEAEDASGAYTQTEIGRRYGVKPVTLKALITAGNGMALVWDRTSQQHVLIEEDPDARVEG
jgi:hypothetical protein